MDSTCMHSYRKLYKHTLESIFANLTLTELSRVVATCRDWSAAVHSMRPIDCIVDVSEPDMHLLGLPKNGTFVLQLNTHLLRDSDLLRHVSRLVLHTNQEPTVNEMAILCGIIMRSKTLKEVDLWYIGGVDDGGAIKLACALQTSTSIKRVKLNSSQFGQVGTAAITNAIGASKTIVLLVLNQTQIGTDGVDAVSRAIIQNKSIDTVRLVDTAIWTDDVVVSFSHVIEQSTSLTSMDLGSNQIGPNGAVVLANAIKQSMVLRIHSLNLSDNPIGLVGATAVADAIAHSESMTDVNLSHIDIGTAGTVIAWAIKKSHTLTKLNLYNTHMDDADITAIGEALCSSTSMSVLDIGRNIISPAGVIVIANAMKTSKTMTTWVLYDVDMRTEGAVAIANAIKHGSSATCVSLRFNKDIGLVGMYAIADALRHSKSMTSIDLSYNRIHDDEGDTIISAVLQSASMTNLNLDGNSMSHWYTQTSVEEEARHKHISMRSMQFISP